MVLDVSQLIQNDGAVKEIDLSLKLEDLSFNGQDIVFETPFRLKGVVKNIAGILYLNIDADVSFATQCARCLDKVNEHISFNISEAFSKVSNDNEDVTVLESGNIDLDEVTQKAFIYSLPISYLCKEDCKGLCQVCGCNLNYESCLCNSENIDPRLAVLKEFLEN